MTQVMNAEPKPKSKLKAEFKFLKAKHGNKTIATLSSKDKDEILAYLWEREIERAKDEGMI